jgi:two-component system OmpR family sensor kinase
MVRFIADVPLRVKLIAAVLTLVTMALLVIGVASALVMKSSMFDKVDQQLRTMAETVDLSRLATTNASQDSILQSNYYIAWVTPLSSGAIESGVVGTRKAAEAPPIPGTVEVLQSRLGTPYTATTPKTHERWRILIIKRDGTLLLVAESLSMVDSAVDELVAAELFVGAGVLVVLAAVGVAMVRASLQPLREIERTAAAIAAGDLTRRVPESPPETEMGHLAAALNAMLAQIEGAFRLREASEERMRQFIADASHELRTPLTTIRGFAELYRQGAARQPEETGALLRRIEDEAARMGLLVEDLLMLARLDQERPLALADMDLRVIASDAVAAARAVAPDRTIDLEIERDEPIEVHGDESRLRQVVGNLVTNALTHTPPGTRVTLTVAQDAVDPDRVVLQVADEGPGMDAADADRAFERFYRADASRTREAGGTGLGLAIVSSLVAAHGGTVELSTAPGKGAAFTVRLPRSGPPERPAPGGGAEAVPQP